MPRPPAASPWHRLALAFVLLVAACTLHRERQLDRRYGDELVRDREVAQAGPVDYATQVRPILEARCVVCHGCYDAPCQLKLGSPEGLDRGIYDEPVYDSTRLRAAKPTRLFEDEQRTAGWRARGFDPVLNERAQSREANREAGLLFRALELARAHPPDPGAPLPDDLDTAIDRDAKCPTTAAYPRFARKHPSWGMPFGMATLDEREHDVLTQWLLEGATHTKAPPLSQQLQTRVAEWERFFNGDSAKSRLASRYLYEHLFYAHLHFGEAERPQFFELVRSKTPPGRAIVRITTRRPYDDPGVERVWYRLQPVRETIVAKQHMPYLLDEARMQRWHGWFIAPEYTVDALPGYEREQASNPFTTFAALPVRARYRFMLDEAEYTLMGFIKGPVCRGPGALNVIDEQFWVFFVDPDLGLLLHDDDFLRRQAPKLRLPASASSTARPLGTWLRQSRDETEWARAKQKALAADFRERAIDLSLVWDGDGENPNAGLTVFRHYDSATVVKGLVGAEPKTAWVIDYPILERIHYLLVAGFDVYGNVGHQLATRTYMDFLRMESELMFLQLLPERTRERERAFWYRDTDERAYREIVERLSHVGNGTALRFESGRHKHELFARLQQRLAPVLVHDRDIDREAIPDPVRDALVQLSTIAGTRLRRVPETAFLLVPDAPAGAQVYTLVRNDAHSNIASPFFEKQRRLPAEDTLTVAIGFVGSYPNAFYVVPQAQLPAFVQRMGELREAADQGALQTEFGVRRTDPELWRVSDQLAAIYRRDRPIDAGLLDLSRYERPVHAD